MPAPTQRPRPIGSSSFTGDKPPPKRPRRQVRGSSASSNPPPPPSTERNRLDELLDRFLDITSRPGSNSSTPQSGASTLRTSTASTASTSRSNLSGGSLASTSSRTLADRTNGVRTVGVTRSLPYMKGGAQELRATKSAPRPVAHLANERPIRSSPRRSKPAHSVEASPLRALAVPLPLEHRNTARMSTAANQQHLSTRAAVVPPPRTAPRPSHSTPSRVTRSTTVPNAAGRPLPPQPSSDGDTSIDSLDMAFECGGEDVDRLFQMMDGGR